MKRRRRPVEPVDRLITTEIPPDQPEIRLLKIMILGETALSFLGLGIRPPMTSWGVLLNQAQRVNVLLYAPWLAIPVFFVIAAVLAFNFLGDGLRDAADPYSL